MRVDGSSSGTRVPLAPVGNETEIEAAIDALRQEQGGLIVLSDGFMHDHRAAIIAATTRNKVPTFSGVPDFPREGGLLSYVPRFSDMFRLAAGYVDRVLKGDKTTDLPVQAPVKWDLVINQDRKGARRDRAAPHCWALPTRLSNNFAYDC